VAGKHTPRKYRSATHMGTDGHSLGSVRSHMGNSIAIYVPPSG